MYAAAASAAAAASIYAKQLVLHIYAVLAVDGIAPPSCSLAEPAFSKKCYIKVNHCLVSIRQ